MDGIPPLSRRSLIAGAVALSAVAAAGETARAADDTSGSTTSGLPKFVTSMAREHSLAPDSCKIHDLNDLIHYRNLSTRPGR